MMNIATREPLKDPVNRQNVDKEIIINTFQGWDLQGFQGGTDDRKCDVNLPHKMLPPLSQEQQDLLLKRKEDRLSPTTKKKGTPKRSDIGSKRPTKVACQGSGSDDGLDYGTSTPISPLNSPERRSRSSYSKRPSERRLTLSPACLEKNSLQHTDKDGKSKSAPTSRRPSQHGSTTSDTMAASAHRPRRAASDRNLFPSPHNSPQRRSGAEKASPTRRQMIHRLGTASGHGTSSSRRLSLSTKPLSARSLYQEAIAPDHALVSSQSEIERKSAERRKPSNEYAPPTLTRSASTRPAMRRNSLSVVPSQSHEPRAEGLPYSTEEEPQRFERKRPKGVDAKASVSSRRSSKPTDSSPSKPARTTAHNSCHGAPGKREDRSGPSSTDRSMIRRGSSRRLVSKSKETGQWSGADSKADSMPPNSVPSTAFPDETARIPEPLTNPSLPTLVVSETRRRLHAAQSSRRLLTQGALPESTDNSGTSSNVAPASPLDPPKARRRYSTGTSQHETPFSFGGLRQVRSRESQVGADDSPQGCDLPKEQPQRPSSKASAGGGGQLKNSLHQLCATTFGGVSLHKNHKHSDLVSIASEMTDLNGVAQPPSSKTDIPAKTERAAPSTSGPVVTAPYCSSSIQIDLSDPTNIDFYFFKTSHQSCGGGNAAASTALGRQQQHWDDDTTTVTTTRSFG